MKTILLSLSIFFCYIAGYSQGMENWDFSINEGNCAGCVDCSNYLDLNLYGIAVSEGPNFPNWHITHGSPNFPTSSGAVYPNAITLATDRTSSGTPLGEGLAGGYNFTIGQTYTIGVGFTHSPNPAIFRLALVKGPMPYNGACGYVDCDGPGYQGNLPSVDPANIDYLTLSTYNDGNNTVTFTATKNYNWVWIYSTDAIGCNDLVEVRHIYVVPSCREELHLNTAVIPPSDYTSYKRIFAGSGTTGFMSTLTAPAKIEATEQVIFINNLDIRPTNGAVIAEINPYACDYPPFYLPKPGRAPEPASAGSSHLGTRLVQDTKESAITPQVTVAPNPTADVITITIRPGTKNNIITLMQTDGKVLQTKITTDSETVISVKEYPAGLYLVRVNTGKESIVTKLIKTP